MASGTVASDNHPADQPIEKEETKEIKMVKDEEVIHKEDGEEKKKQEIETAKDIKPTESEGLASKVLETGGVPKEPNVATMEEKEVPETMEPPPLAAEPIESKHEEKAEEAVMSKTIAEEKIEVETEEAKDMEKPAVEAVEVKLKEKSVEEMVESKVEESVMAKDVEGKVEEKHTNESFEIKIEEKVESETASVSEVKEQRGSEAVVAGVLEKVVDVNAASESEEKVEAEAAQSELKDQITTEAAEVVQSGVKERITNKTAEAEVMEKVEAGKIASGSVEKVQAESVVKETAEVVTEELKEEAVAEYSEKLETVKVVAADVVDTKEVSEKMDEMETKPLSITKNVAEKAVEEQRKPLMEEDSAVVEEVQVTARNVSATLAEAFAAGDTKNEEAPSVVEDKAAVSEVAEQVKEHGSEKIEGRTEELSLAEKTTPETEKVEEVEKKDGPVKDEKPASVKAPIDSKDVNTKEVLKSETKEETKESEETKAFHDLLVQELPAKPKQSGNIISKVKQSLVKVKKAIVGKSPRSKALSVDAEEGEKVK